MGGALAAIEQGFFQREIQDAAYKAQKAIESKEALVVGVNEFVIPAESPIPTLTINPKIEAEQVARLAAFRSRRDAAAVERRRAELVAGARDGRNLMPVIVDAVNDHVTLGEIIESLRGVFGEYREAVTV